MTIENNNPTVVGFSGKIRGVTCITAGVVTLDRMTGGVKEAHFRPAHLKEVFELAPSLRAGRKVSGRMVVMPGAKRGEITAMTVHIPTFRPVTTLMKLFSRGPGA